MCQHAQAGRDSEYGKLTTVGANQRLAARALQPLS